MGVKKRYRLGTRRSLLAQTQSEYVRDLLAGVGIECELVLTESEGDQNLKSPLYEIESATPGLFTKQLELALLRNEIDLAVHSLKDLPTTQPPELTVGAIPVREAAGDCLVIHRESFSASETVPLKRGTVVGTSSLRREAQLAETRKDVSAVPIRGNVPRRLQQIDERKFGATLLAQAGLNRLKLELGALIRIDLPTDQFIPAPGQGALAVEIHRDADSQLISALRKIHHEPTARATRVERAVLKAMMGGCTLPLGVYVCPSNNSWELKAFLGEMEGPRGSSERRWVGFRRFDFSSTDDETLVAKTVSHFKDVSREPQK